MFDAKPFLKENLFEIHSQKEGTKAFSLILYSIVKDLKSKIIGEIGLGDTTKILRLAAIECNAVLHSCDKDKARFEYLLPSQDENWKLHLVASEEYISNLPNDIDFFMHDGAHDYYQVKTDIELLIPKMKKFGIICIHDTQQPQLVDEMLDVVKDISKQFPVSFTHLPYSCGMTIMRVEESQNTSVDGVHGILRDGSGKSDTLLKSCPSVVSNNIEYSSNRNVFSLSKWLLRKVVKGY